MLSLITLARGRRRQLAGLLRAACHMQPPPAEVVVVDMGGAPVQVPDGLQVRVVSLPVDDVARLPLAAARNRGAEAAAGSRLVFLDVDCLPGVDLAGEMDAALERRRGLVMAHVRYLPKGFVDDGCERTRIEASDPHPTMAELDRDVPRELFWSTTFGVRREDFVALGGFCEDYVGYGAEDTDLGFTAAAADMEISRWSTALAYHQWHPSPSPPLQHLDSIVRNATLFHRRWGHWPMEGWLEEFAELGLVEWAPHDGHLRRTDDRVAPA